MPATKTTTLTFRLEPCFKEALRTAAVRGQGSIAHMIQVKIRGYCARMCVLIQDSLTAGADSKKKTK